MAKNPPAAVGHVNILWQGEELKRRCSSALFGLIEQETKNIEEDAHTLSPVFTGAVQKSINRRFKQLTARCSGTVATGSQDGLFVEVGTEDTPAFRMLRQPFNSALSRVVTKLPGLVK